MLGGSPTRPEDKVPSDRPGGSLGVGGLRIHRRYREAGGTTVGQPFERLARRRRRHTDPGRRVHVLHLGPLGRCRTRASARVVRARHALRLRAPASAERAAARTARGGDDGSVQWHLRLARSSRRRAGGFVVARVASPVRRPGHARGPRGPELRREGGTVPTRARRGLRLRRPLRGEGRSRREDRCARPSTREGPPRVRYERGDFRRSTHVQLSTAAEINGDVAAFDIELPTRGEWSVCVQYTPVLDDVVLRPRHRCGRPVEHVGPGAAALGMGAPTAGHDRRARAVRATPRPLHRGSRRAPDLRSGAPEPGRGRGRRAVVHDALWPRLVADVVDGDDGRP